MLTLIMDNYCKAQHCLGVEKIPHSFCHPQLRAEGMIKMVRIHQQAGFTSNSLSSRNNLKT